MTTGIYTVYIIYEMHLPFDYFRTLGSNEKQALINGKYEKWRIQYGQPAETSARTSTDGGISAVVGAMICLSVMIGIGGIIMIVILIK